MEVIVCFDEYQSTQKVHQALVLTSPGAEAGHDRLIVAVAVYAVSCPARAPDHPSYDNRDQFLHRDRQVYCSSIPLDLESHSLVPCTTAPTPSCVRCHHQGRQDCRGRQEGRSVPQHNEGLLPHEVCMEACIKTNQCVIGEVLRTLCRRSIMWRKKERPALTTLQV